MCELFFKTNKSGVPFMTVKKWLSFILLYILLFGEQVQQKHVFLLAFLPGYSYTAPFNAKTMLFVST